MKISQLLTKTIKQAPSREESLNSRLLIQAGFIDKTMAGVYSFLPLGWRVMKKLKNIIREEMDGIGGQEIFMPSLSPREFWETTGRLEKVDNLFQARAANKLSKQLNDSSYVICSTHEEVVTPLVQKHTISYKDLPVAVYQIQNKFRNEARPKSGLLRGREFLMKDLYSFHTTQEDLKQYYEEVKKAYLRVFERLGVLEDTYVTLASGGDFTDEYSHEFQTLCQAGEDEIYLCSNCSIAINKEIIDETPECPECGKKKGELEVKKSIEVGNIFPLSTKFSEPFNLNFADSDGSEKQVIMGCYGIGISRVMGAVVEMMSDEKGIVWPEKIAPFKVHLISINQEEEAEKIYKNLSDSGIEVLYDDREKSPGEKFADSDLLGIPYRIVVSKKTLQNSEVEIKRREKEEVEFVKISEVIKYVEKNTE